MRRATILRRAGRYGLVLAVWIGSLFALPNSFAGPPQADAPSGTGDADQAYREVTAKNYAGAMQDFRRALTAEPSNALWRKDLGFACLEAGLPADAAKESAVAY